MLISIKFLIFICIVFANTQYIISQEFEWARDFGGTTSSLGHRFRSSIDKESNIICAGIFDGYPNTYLDFNQTVPTTGGGMGVSKIDSLGNLIWVTVFPIQMIPNGVNILSDSSIFVSGTFSSTINIDPSGANVTLTAIGYNDGFIMKVSSDGQFEWIRQYEQTGLDKFNVAVDEQDNVYTAVSFTSDSVDCDPLNDSLFVFSSNGYGTFISKTSNQGDLLWVKQFEVLTTSGYINFRDMSVYNDKIHIGGLFNGIVDFDPGTNTQIIDSDTSQYNSNALFIMKLDTSGAFEWVKTFSGQESNSNNAGLLSRTFDCLVIDTLENIYAMGNHILPIDFDPDPNQTNFYPLNGINTYGYILKLNSLGDFKWVKHVKIGGSGCSGCGTIISTNQSLSLDNRGFIYWGGRGRGTVDFDPGVGVDDINLSGNGGMFFAKYDTDGNYVWGVGTPELTLGTVPSKSYITSLNLYKNGDLFISGHTVFQIDLDPSTNNWILDPPYGTSFIAKYSQDVCSEIFISIDSLDLVSCAGNGYIASSLHHASTPFEYTWNGQTTSGFEFLSVNEYGLNHFYAMDSSGCEANKYALMDGPLYFSSHDLNINTMSSSFRPGFDAFIHLNALNDGCLPQDGEIRLILDPGLTFNYSTTAPTSINGDTIIWEFNGLNYDSSAIYYLINVSVSDLLQIGDSICIEVQINPEFGDANVSNNYKVYCHPLINGYDPNDKQVFPEGKCEEKFISSSEPLTYMIRFQNTGNASAINITIKDSILPNLDLNSIHILGSSHQMHVDIIDTNNVQFVFDNINLPDSTTNLEGSQGSLFFTIQPSSTSVTGDIVKNSAEIYFDFNPPIITNETFNTLYQGDLSLFICNLSISETAKYRINVFPNPTTGIIYFNGFIDQNVTRIEVWDISGRMISCETNPGQDSFKFINSGLFLVKFISENTIIGIQKIIVEP